MEVKGGGRDLHLRVEQARIRINDSDSAVERLDSIVCLILTDHSCEVQAKLLRVHICLEGEWQALLLAWRDLDSILLGSQVADDARAADVEVGCPQTAANELDGDGLRFFIAEGEAGISGLAINELNAEDLGVGEGGGDKDIQVRRGAGSVDFFVWDLYTVRG